jgi:hypothetical protein
MRCCCAAGAAEGPSAIGLVCSGGRCLRHLPVEHRLGQLLANALSQLRRCRLGWMGFEDLGRCLQSLDVLHALSGGPVVQQRRRLPARQRLRLQPADTGIRQAPKLLRAMAPRAVGDQAAMGADEGAQPVDADRKLTI